MSRISEIREREKAATPGDWERTDGTIWVAVPEQYLSCCGQGHDECCGTGIAEVEWHQERIAESNETDAAFIAHARADIPYLLARLDEAVGMLKAYAIEVSPCRSCGEIIFLATDHDPHCALNAIIKGVEG